VIRIDGYAIDIAVRETHRFSGEVTKYPRETGSKGADSVVLDPDAVTLECIVSDTPLPGPMAAERGDTGDGLDLATIPSDDAFAFLQLVRSNAEPVQVVTSRQTYDDMVLTSLEVTEDGETGHALSFTAEFEKAVFFTNNRTTVKVAPPKQTGLGAKKDFGNKIVYDVKSGAVIWHHHSFDLRGHDVWTEEVIGYKQSERDRGLPGWYHQNGQALTADELKQFNADHLAWYGTHDRNGQLFTNSSPTDLSIAATDALPPNTTWDAKSGSFIDEQGQPIEYNPLFHVWSEK